MRVTPACGRPREARPGLSQAFGRCDKSRGGAPKGERAASRSASAQQMGLRRLRRLVCDARSGGNARSCGADNGRCAYRRSAPFMGACSLGGGEQDSDAMRRENGYAMSDAPSPYSQGAPPPVHGEDAAISFRFEQCVGSHDCPGGVTSRRGTTRRGEQNSYAGIQLFVLS